ERGVAHKPRSPQFPLLQALSPVHGLAQAPQFWLLVLVLTQAPLQQVMPMPQVTPQAPQFLSSSLSLMPSSDLPSQSSSARLPSQRSSMGIASTQTGLPPLHCH